MVGGEWEQCWLVGELFVGRPAWRIENASLEASLWGWVGRGCVWKEGGSLVQANSSLGISLREDAPLPAQDWGQCSTTVIRWAGGLSQEAVGC